MEIFGYILIGFIVVSLIAITWISITEKKDTKYLEEQRKMWEDKFK